TDRVGRQTRGVGVSENARPRNNQQSHTNLASNHCASQPCVRSTPTYVKIVYNGSGKDCFSSLFLFSFVPSPPARATKRASSCKGEQHQHRHHHTVSLACSLASP
ncbi:unnamed protein product, partial [Ectocarpus sp. 12 AP-2014]